MLRISIFLFLIGAILAADKCADNNYKHHGEECTCSDFCVDNSHCQRNGHGGYSCQCLPCLTYDPEKGHCVHDCRHTTPKPPPTTSEGPCENRLVADIYLLFDASNSITATGWRRALNFGTSIIDTFTVSSTDVQFAFGIFSTTFNHSFNLNYSHSKAALAQRVNETLQLKTNTNTGDALKAINDNDYLYAPALGGNRNVRKILVVVTDGQSQDTAKTKAEAKILRDKGVLVFVVGVGYLNDDELVGIAGELDHVFKVLSYGGLIDILKNLTDKFCGQVTTPPPPTTTTTKGPCPKRLVADTYLLLDSSNSITAIGWSRALGFASAIIEKFTVSPSDVQFAFGIFSTPFKHIFDLNYSYDKVVLTEKVGTTAHLQTNTHTGEALDIINDDNYLYEVSLGGRREVRKILVIVTDGQSQDTEATKAAAKRLQDKGVLTFAVGVGFTNQDELIALAGSTSRVFNVQSYGGLINILESLTETFCHGL